MAPQTPLSVRNLVMYSVYTRAYGPTGSFADVQADLERIAGMGVDVLWLMPIHPIGRIARKGPLGSPYSISDYRAINPEYGTLDDFTRLVEKAHALGLKVMIDVVYNHTAHDSVLVREHPDWFNQDENGVPVTTVPEWSDIIDLKFPNEALEDYLAESLVYWARQGVDGFRCDVASLIPVSFWLKARAAVEAVKPGVIWMAETVHAGFVEYRRSKGLRAWSDTEMYQAFDLTYDYDIWPVWQQAVLGGAPVERYLEMLRFQDAIYPGNYAKMRCVENHDQARIQALARTPAQALAWTAFMAFNKGAFFLYNGQESAVRRTPTLFDRDPIQWGERPLQGFLTRLAKLKKDRLAREGVFTLLAAEPAIQAAWHVADGEALFGVFNINGASGSAAAPIADGEYTNLLDDATVSVRAGQVELPASALIVRVRLAERPERPLYTPLLDFHQPAEPQP